MKSETAKKYNLKRCPFCGSYEIHFSAPRYEGYYENCNKEDLKLIPEEHRLWRLSCYDCDCETKPYSKTDYEQIYKHYFSTFENLLVNEWNTRTNIFKRIRDYIYSFIFVSLQKLI